MGARVDVLIIGGGRAGWRLDCMAAGHPTLYSSEAIGDKRWEGYASGNYSGLGNGFVQGVLRVDIAKE